MCSHEKGYPFYILYIKINFGVNYDFLRDFFLSFLHATKNIEFAIFLRKHKKYIEKTEKTHNSKCPKNLATPGV